MGFNPNSTISSNLKTKSLNNVDINQGLKYIEIKSSNIVDIKKNILSRGGRSNVILTLPVVSYQYLKGSITNYTDMESVIPINRGCYNNIKFNVVANNNKNIGNVLLDLYIR